MVPEMEKPRVTEIKVRMDCNGCVQKIKKALNGITGIYDIYIDFPQQKITIIGWADPEKLVKAIKKTRKSAVICVHTEQPDEPAQPNEPTLEDAAAPEEGAPPPPPPPSEPTNPPVEPTQTEATPPPAEAPNEQPQPENPPPESANATSEPHQPPRPKDLDEVRVIYHPPPNYGYRHGGHWNGYHGGPVFRGEPPQPAEPVYVTHSYNTYKPTPNVTEYANPRSDYDYRCGGQWNGNQGGPGFGGDSSQPSAPFNVTHSYNTFKPTPYVTEYAYLQPGYEYRYGGQWNGYHGGPGFRGDSSQPPEPFNVTHSYNTYKPTPYVTEYGYPRSPTGYPFYSRPDNYSQDYYRNYGNGNITSMFSEENPNACRIV